TTENLFSIAMISLNNIWIVGHHGMVLHSTDGGNNWVMNNTLSSEQLNSIAFKDNRGYIAGNNGTLLQSNDYGNTWQPVSLSIIDDLFSLSMTESNTQLLAGQANEEYVAYFADEIYKTEDDSTWTNYYVPNFMDIGVANLYFLNDNVGFYLDAAAAFCNCSHMNIFKTTDSGQTWSISYQASTYNSNSPFFSGFSDLIFVNDTIGYAYVSSKFFKTINGGSSWLSTSKKDFNFESFTIYPNPSHGNTINLEFSNPATSDFTFEISNISGKHVFSVERIENGPINISSLENGLYFVTILDDGKFIGSEKFIKSN
ncbi:MAG TPA: YCF48-related protein, partial [Flavobacteriaceae bacterium]|nr:YCF48-related protein [Flavobacteriaceae bacterium]